MKKNNIKPLVMSALASLALGAVGTVGTFALFTDKAETTVSIEAGKVDVSTGVTIQKAYSLNAQDATSVTSGTEATYVNGGSASVDGSIVEIKKWTPGDGIKLRTSPVNGSNVNILSRIKISLVGDLAPALEIRVRSAGASDEYDTNVIYGRIGAGQLVSDWVSLAYSETPNNPMAYDIDIVFPDHDNGEIKFGADNKDNKYMDSTATVVIAYEAVQGNADVGANLLERINTTLATESIRDNGYNKTMFDAMTDITEANLADEAAVKAAGYVWSPETDQFYDFSSAPADAYKYFKIADTKAAAGDYSIYASSAWNVSPVSVSGVGFDVGSHTSDIASVSYTGLGETYARSNIIRTNSLDTDVIADAPYDTVQHYGDAHTVIIHDIANHSYHEFGRVALMDVTKGRVALEAGSDVKNLHFSASKPTETEKTFDAITVAYDESVTLPTFSRDAVQIAAEGTLVVELQNSVDEQKADSDYVWLFQQGLKEQIRITEEVPTVQVAEKVAEAPKSTDSSVASKTSVAAEQIANNLSGNATYKTYEELQEAGAINTDGSVKSEILAAQDAIIEDVGVEQTAEAKQAAFEEIVEETISVIAGEESENYVVRIKSDFFESFHEAFAKAKSGDTIRVLANNNINADNTYDVTGKDITINVEKGAVLNFGSVTNYKFTIGWNNNAGKLDFEGEGKITFGKDNNYGLVKGTGNIGSSRVTFRGLTVEASASGALLTVGVPFYIESGHFKNIAADSYAHISGGLFSNYVSIGLVEGKMCVNDSGDANYPWIIKDLDAAHANFAVSSQGAATQYFTTFKSANDAMAVGKTLTFLENAENVSISDHAVWFVSGATYDLGGKSFTQANQGYYAINVTGNSPVTIKNGSIHSAGTNKLISQGDQLTALNARFDDKDKADVLATVTGGDYLKDQENSFSIVAETPTDYAAKIIRSGNTVQNYYFAGENGVKFAIEQVKNGENILVKAEQEGTCVAPLAAGETFSITLDSISNFPTVSAQGGEAQASEIVDNTRTYTVVAVPGITLNGVEKDSIKQALGQLSGSGNDVIELGADQYIDEEVKFALNGNLTVDFKGHTIYVEVSSNSYYLGAICISNATNSKITFKDSSNKTGSEQGGIHMSTTNYQPMIGCAKGTNGLQVQFDSGYYFMGPSTSNALDLLMLRYVKGSIVINGGMFVTTSTQNNYNYLYNVSYNTSNITISGGIFRSDLFNTLTLLSGHQANEKFDTIDTKDYYQYVAQQS